MVDEGYVATDVARGSRSRIPRRTGPDDDQIVTASLRDGASLPSVRTGCEPVR